MSDRYTQESALTPQQIEKDRMIGKRNGKIIGTLARLSDDGDAEKGLIVLTGLVRSYAYNGPCINPGWCGKHPGNKCNRCYAKEVISKLQTDDTGESEADCTVCLGLGHREDSHDAQDVFTCESCKGTGKANP